ncbi:MAG: methyltransferase domain-containing protein [Alphaproteobacteria bacterium]|nr:methyltransferase domain-containing protein [Alphaproteobacteria bacterium]
MTQLNWPTLAEEISRGTVRDPMQHFRARQKRNCPLCGFTGYFLSAGPRQEARCPNCASKERDRIIALYLRRNNLDPKDKRVLHFSAERPFFHQWKNNPKYVAGDIKRSAVANAVVDITALTYPDNEFDVIVCNHVLEHVQEDAKGMAECFRVMKPGGVGVFSVPMDVTADETWNPPPGTPQAEIERICGRTHVRLYGLDFPKLLASHGFVAEEILFSPEENERHRLAAEKVYVVRKPAAN